MGWGCPQIHTPEREKGKKREKGREMGLKTGQWQQSEDKQTNLQTNISKCKITRYDTI